LGGTRLAASDASRSTRAASIAWVGAVARAGAFGALAARPRPVLLALSE
jgi:hypothetical protein